MLRRAEHALVVAIQLADLLRQAPPGAAALDLEKLPGGNLVGPKENGRAVLTIGELAVIGNSQGVGQFSDHHLGDFGIALLVQTGPEKRQRLFLEGLDQRVAGPKALEGGFVHRVGSGGDQACPADVHADGLVDLLVHLIVVLSGRQGCGNRRSLHLTACVFRH